MVRWITYTSSIAPDDYIIRGDVRDKAVDLTIHIRKKIRFVLPKVSEEQFHSVLDAQHRNSTSLMSLPCGIGKNSDVLGACRKRDPSTSKAP
jgi:hypothetical protein